MVLVKIQLAAAALAVAAIVSATVQIIMNPAPIPPGRQDATARRSARSAPDQPAAPTPPERGVERFRLTNGLKVILRPIQGAENTAMVVVYSIGEDHDPQGRSGLAHSIEHLYVTAAAGATKARSSEDLFGKYPAGANAQTGDRYTVFATVFSKGQLDHELGDAAARMVALRVTAADLNRERRRLLQEVANMFEGFPALAAVNNARELVRPAPAGRHGGQPEQVRAIALEEIQARLSRYYKPRNATLALAGDFDPAAARQAIESHFGSLPAGEEVPPPREPDGPKFMAIRAVE